MKIVKPSNMEIKVTSCADCPFSKFVIRIDDYMCSAIKEPIPYPIFADDLIFSVCPLKQDSITVKLEENATN